MSLLAQRSQEESLLLLALGLAYCLDYSRIRIHTLVQKLLYLGIACAMSLSQRQGQLE